MKILIPMNEDKVSEGICPSFGRAPFFMVYNTEDKSETFVKNEAADSPSGAGIKAAQIVVDLKPNKVMTPRIGKNSADVITAEGITIYKSISDDVKENINLFEEGKIEELTDIHPGFHQHG